MTRMIVVRHGYSTGNEQRRFFGHHNGPLTDIGRRQAALAAAYLKDTRIDAAYASDLDRAYETAAIICAPHGVEVVRDAALREIYGGDWETLLHTECAQRYPEENAVWETDTYHAVPPNGESVRDMTDRIHKALWRIARENDGKTVLIASHSTPIRSLVCEWEGKRYEDFTPSRRIKNVAVSIVDYDVSTGKTIPLVIGESSFLGAIDNQKDY